MTRQERWDRLAEAVDARRQLRCVSCGRHDDRRERGWTLHLGAEAQLHAFCPACGAAVWLVTERIAESEASQTNREGQRWGRRSQS